MVILLVTAMFRPVKLMEPVLFAFNGLETVIWLPVVVRFRLLPLMNEVALATVICPDVELVKLTDRSSTKFPVDVPK